MKLQTAIKQAIKKAKFLDDEIYIICEDGEYHWATNWDLDTFYLGATVLYTVLPDGSVE